MCIRTSSGAQHRERRRFGLRVADFGMRISGKCNRRGAEAQREAGARIADCGLGRGPAGATLVHCIDGAPARPRRSGRAARRGPGLGVGSGVGGSSRRFDVRCAVNGASREAPYSAGSVGGAAGRRKRPGMGQKHGFGASCAGPARTALGAMDPWGTCRFRSGNGRDQGVFCVHVARARSEVMTPFNVMVFYCLRIILTLIVVALMIMGAWRCFRRCKKGATIMLLASPFYLVIAHYMAPWINWRGKFDSLWQFAREIGLSQQNSVAARWVFLFFCFWIIFFGLSALTFKVFRKQSRQSRRLG